MTVLGHDSFLPASHVSASLIVSFILLSTLSFESIPLPVRAQVLPLTSILAVFFLPFISKRIYSTPLLKSVVLFGAYALFHSLIGLFIDVAVRGDGGMRVFTWFRQVVSLTLGISVFLVLRTALVKVTDSVVIRIILLGSLPSLTIGLLSVAWNLTGLPLAANIVTEVRSWLIPYGYTAPARVSGLSSEPSHFALYLSTVLIPIIIAKTLIVRKRLFWFLSLALAVFLFLFTVSTTGLVVLLSFLFSGVLFGPRRRSFVVTAFLFSMLIVAFVVLFPDNYAVLQVNTVLSDSPSFSFNARLYSIIGPIMNLFSSPYAWFGYGLGGIGSHFNEVMPGHIRDQFMEIVWEGMGGSLTSLTGRLIVETGLIGLFLFFRIIVAGLGELRWVRQRALANSEVTLPRMAKPALFAFLISSVMGAGGSGSFILPYLWFWLALIDSRYILIKRELSP